jgi:hypothetical protein
MHALLVSVTIEPATLDQAREALRSQVVPRVSSQPGFITGYWYEPKQAGSVLEGSSVILFDTEANAKTGAEMAKNAPTPSGVTITSAEVREIQVHAQSPTLATR